LLRKYGPSEWSVETVLFVGEILHSMKQAALCFLVAFLQSDLCSCIRDDLGALDFAANGSKQSEGVVLTANELRYISAAGSTLEDFEADFNKQVNELYSEHLEKDDYSDSFKQGTSLLDASRGALAKTRDFCPTAWLPMLAEQGRTAGSGSFGQVYTVNVECSGTPTLVAVKLETQQNPNTAREIRAGMSFDHANLVKFYDHDTTSSGKSVIMMEAIPDGDLDKKLQETPSMTMAELSKYVLEALHGLEYIHDKGMVHADFKPEQVMLTCDSSHVCHAKLGDFGFADEDRYPEIRGTPTYMSPELLATGELSKTADMWAVGISLFEMTHKGRMPSFLETATSIPKLPQLMQHIYYNEQYFTKHVVVEASSPIDKLISGLLTVNTANRFTVDDAIAAAKAWALQYHKREQVEAFGKNDLNERVKLPSCWATCRGKCSEGRCKEEHAQPKCISHVSITNANTNEGKRTIVHKGTVHGFKEVEITISPKFSVHITDSFKLDKDARILFAQHAAISAGFKALDIIVEVAGLRISGDNVHMAGDQVIDKLTEMAGFEIKVKVLRPQLTQLLKQIHQIQPIIPRLVIQPHQQQVREQHFDPYFNYPKGGWRERLVLK